MAKKTVESDPTQALKDAFAAFIDNLIANAAGSAPAESEDEGDKSDGERERLESLSLAALKKEAVAAGYEASDLKGLDKDDIIEALLNPEDDEDEGEDEDDDDEPEDDEDEGDEEDDEDEDGDYTRDDLEDKTLKELRDIAKEQGASASDVKGLDQDELIDLILGDDDEDEEDEDDEESDDEDEDDDDSEELTEDDLNEMSESELKKLASDMDVKIRKNATKKSIIAALLDAAE